VLKTICFYVLDYVLDYSCCDRHDIVRACKNVVFKWSANRVRSLRRFSKSQTRGDCSFFTISSRTRIGLTRAFENVLERCRPRVTRATIRVVYVPYVRTRGDAYVSNLKLLELFFFRHYTDKFRAGTRTETENRKPSLPGSYINIYVRSTPRRRAYYVHTRDYLPAGFGDCVICPCTSAYLIGLFETNRLSCVYKLW